MIRQIFALIAFLPLFSFATELPESSLYHLKTTWTNHKGKEIQLHDLVGSPRLLVMLYTRCETTCPLILEDLRSTLSALSEDERKRIQISLFSFDSHKENAESLSQFATQRKLDDRWNLYFGNQENVALLAAVLGVKYKRLEDNHYIHSNKIFFLNEMGEIQAERDGLKSPRADFIKKVKAALKK